MQNRVNNKNNNNLIKNRPRRRFNKRFKNNYTNNYNNYNRNDDYYISKALNNKKKNRNKININNKRTNIINNKLKTINKKLNQLRLNNNNNKLVIPTTNLKKMRKEMRRDKIITAYQMSLSNRFLSLFPTTNRITYQKIYNRWEIQNDQYRNTHLTWFPYAINFSTYPGLDIAVDDGNGIPRQPNAISILIKTQNVHNVDRLDTLQVLDTTACGIPGMYRIVCASFKITNTTSAMNRAGSYIIYKINENEMYPPFYNKELLPDKINSPEYFQEIGKVIMQNHDQLSVKQSYSANDIAFIHEFNTYEGNNIFQGSVEYIGQKFITSPEPVALWGLNPNGNNIKYQIDIPVTNPQNSYLLECWQIVEIVPHPSLNLDNISHIQNTIFTKNVLNELRTYNPLKRKL